MRREDFLREMDELLELDPGTLTGREALADLAGWDSLAVISFIALTDEKLDTVIDGESLAKAATVQNLLDLLGDRLAA
jgi:acyl carrier protein